MNYLKMLENLNFWEIVFGLLIIALAFKELYELYKYFVKTFGFKTKVDTEKEEFVKRVEKLESHDKYQYEKLNEISDILVSISDTIGNNKKTQDAVTVATCRSTLYRLHKEFVSQGYVDEPGLKTFTEIGKVYEDAGGDDIFHDKLKPEVMALEIRMDK